jgi:hypothetical protein
MNRIGAVLRGWFTAADNQSFELGRALWALFGLALVVFEAAHVFWKFDFDPLPYVAAAGSLMAAGGKGIAWKDQANGGMS